MNRKIFVLRLLLHIITITCDQFVLLKVLILSKHGIIAPDSPDLQSITPREWPTWKEPMGHLSDKGAALEEFMGKYFHIWLRTMGIFPSICPEEREIYIYANTQQRTLESAKAFTSTAFPKCKIEIHPHKVSEHFDPDSILEPVIKNNSESFKDAVIKEMKAQLANLKLDPNFDELQNILDYAKSDMCRFEGRCNLTSDRNEPLILHQVVKINGPLSVANKAVDAFLMEYYEGMVVDDVAWGLVSSDYVWNKLFEIKHAYLNVIYNSSMIAKDMARPLLQTIADMFLTAENRKFILFMGHDENILLALKSLGIKPYLLNHQYEKTPVGGNVVFQKWQDMATGQIYLRINYVYQSMKQLREGLQLTLEEPPQSQVLELRKCRTDKGLCPWHKFEKIFGDLQIYGQIGARGERENELQENVTYF